VTIGPWPRPVGDRDVKGSFVGLAKDLEDPMRKRGAAPVSNMIRSLFLPPRLDDLCPTVRFRLPSLSREIDLSFLVILEGGCGGKEERSKSDLASLSLGIQLFSHLSLSLS